MSSSHHSHTVRAVESHLFSAGLHSAWNCGGGIISRRAIRARGSALGSGAQGLAPSSAGATHAALHAAHPADVAAAAAAAAPPPRRRPPPPPPPKPRRPRTGRPAAAALLLLDHGGLRARGASAAVVWWCVGRAACASISVWRRSRRTRTARRVNSGARRRSCGSSGPGRTEYTILSVVEKDGATLATR